MRFKQLKTSVSRSLIGAIVMSLMLFGFSSTSALSTAQAGAATTAGTSSDPFNHALAAGMSRQFATLPALDTALSASIVKQINQATVGMTPAAKADFTILVKAAQAKIKQGLSSNVRTAVTTALTTRGFSQPQIKLAAVNPVLLVTLPISTHVESASASGPRRVSEATVPAVAATPAVSSLAFQPATYPVYRGSSAPNLTESWQDLVGATLVTVKYIKSWSYNNHYITSAPRYQPPTVNFTNLCLGCSFAVTWHDQFWYNYLGHGGHTGFANKIQFTLHQCFGVWLFNQCMADKNINWSLRLHYNGTYSAYYN